MVKVSLWHFLATKDGDISGDLESVNCMTKGIKDIVFEPVLKVILGRATLLPDVAVKSNEQLAEEGQIGFDAAWRCRAFEILSPDFAVKLVFDFELDLSNFERITRRRDGTEDGQVRRMCEAEEIVLIQYRGGFFMDLAAYTQQRRSQSVLWMIELVAAALMLTARSRVSYLEVLNRPL